MQNLGAELIAFLDALFEDLAQAKLDVSRWQLDHVCLRTDSLADYESTKAAFAERATLLSEAQIAGRPIAAYRLHEAIEWRERVIRVIEVPAPKAGKPYLHGFEHAEFVLDQSFAQLAAAHPQLKFEAPVKVHSLNSEMSLSLPRANVKFHYLPLECVIAVEEYGDLLAALAELKFFELLAPYAPLLSGSVPLAVALPGADVDFLLNSHDFSQVKGVFQQMPVRDLEFSEITLQGQPSLVVRFEFKELFFEGVVQSVSTWQQVAHRHLLAEARLLNRFGESLRSRVRKYKGKGFKTEPAFAKALGQSGNGYDLLLDWQKLSEAALVSRATF